MKKILILKEKINSKIPENDFIFLSGNFYGGKKIYKGKTIKIHSIDSNLWKYLNDNIDDIMITSNIDLIATKNKSQTIKAGSPIPFSIQQDKYGQIKLPLEVNLDLTYVDNKITQKIHQYITKDIAEFNLVINGFQDIIPDDVILKLNIFQNVGHVHPYTCGRNHIECEVNTEPRDYSKDGVLIATKEGWICPCGKYTQEIKNIEFIDDNVLFHMTERFLEPNFNQLKEYFPNITFDVIKKYLRASLLELYKIGLFGIKVKLLKSGCLFYDIDYNKNKIKLIYWFDKDLHNTEGHEASLSISLIDDKIINSDGTLDYCINKISDLKKQNIL